MQNQISNVSYVPTSLHSCHTFTSKQCTETKDFVIRSWPPHIFSAPKQTVMTDKPLRNFLVFEV